MFITSQIFQKVSLLRALKSPKKFRNLSSANFLVRGLEDFEVFGLAYTFFRYWKRVEAGLVDKELYASWLGSVNFDAISKLICGPSSRVIYALFALHTAGLQLEIFFFFCHNQMSFKSNHVSFWTSTLSKAVLLEGTMTKQILDSLNTKTCSEY